MRSIYAAWERGDYSSGRRAHPEIEYVIADGPVPGRWTGLTGMAAGWRNWLSAREDFRASAKEYRELDDGRVLVLVSDTGSGKSSALELGQIHTKGAAVLHIRDGTVTRLI
jgi:hypothetical protein